MLDKLINKRSKIGKTSKTNVTPKCPKCGRDLYYIAYGLIHDESKLKEKYGNKYILGGCMCYGDDRDDKYYCKHCKARYGSSLNKRRIIECPLEASGSIFDHECKKYGLMTIKPNYKLLDDKKKICSMICPVMGKQIRMHLFDGTVYVGEITRTFKKCPRWEYDIAVFRKESDDPYKADFIDIPIKDIKDIEVIE